MHSRMTCLLFMHFDDDDNGVLIWRSATAGVSDTHALPDPSGL
jgi:hypothetical protein